MCAKASFPLMLRRFLFITDGRVFQLTRKGHAHNSLSQCQSVASNSTHIEQNIRIDQYPIPVSFPN